MKEIIANDTRLNRLPESTYRKLNERIEAAIRDRVAPTASIAIFHHDEPLLENAWGWVDPQSKQFPVHTSTVFDLASVTKIFTATAFFSLLSEEKTTLHTPIVEVIPEFGVDAPRRIDGGQDPHTKERMPVDTEYEGQSVDPNTITFFHLLTHTSGLPPWRDLYTIADAPLEPPLSDPVSREERWSKALERLVTYPFVGKPDNVIRYSDIGLLLLGEAVSRLHGTPGNLEEAIKDRVLKGHFRHITYNPMKNGFQRHQIAPTEDDQTWRKRRVWGEVHDENACAVGGIAGHAGLFAPAIEVAQFGNLWLNHVDSKLKLDPELAGAATELQAQTGLARRGLAWMLKSPEESAAGDRFDLSTFGHTGFTGTSLWIDPTQNLVVALLTNAVWSGRDFTELRKLRRDVHDILHEGLIR